MVKLQEVNGQYFITIPREYVHDKGWKKGQELIIGFDSTGNLLIRESKIKRENS